MNTNAPLSLAFFQELNGKIYRVVNDRNFSSSAQVSRLHRYSTLLLKLIRKKNMNQADYYLAMSFSWALALANRFHISLEDELWNRFPACCPYCKQNPCGGESCTMQTLPVPLGVSKPSSLSEFQGMLSSLYPNNTLEASATHLAEEVGEVDEAIEHFLATHDQELFKEIVLELVDVVANLFAVASCAGISIEYEMRRHFKNGCPKCVGMPCGCGFTVAKAPLSVACR